MSAKLRPCPFCGSNDLVIKSDRTLSHVDGISIYDAYAQHVHCQTCSSHGRNRIGNAWCQTPQEAADAWNDRPDHLTPYIFEPTLEMTQPVGALRRILDEYEKLSHQVRSLKSQATVHINMLHGTIAVPTLRQMLHVYGNEALEALDLLLAVTKDNGHVKGARARLQELLKESVGDQKVGRAEAEVAQ